MEERAKTSSTILVALTLVGICAVTALLLWVFRRPELPVTGGPTNTPIAADDSWDRIEAAGKLVVGTSADYPPFEFYIGPDQMDGFDIALMREIGRRLGVTIEYHDIAFEGLASSLILRRVDIAIAAISRTSEREAQMDFSNVYLVAQDGILARPDSNITISTAEDLARYRVGVQRNTVYQDWIQRTLIDTGRMSPDKLFAYVKAEHAISDLREARVDLVMLDAQAADAFAKAGNVKVAAIGRGQQNYAIALPIGAAALKTKLDEVITAMYGDGYIPGLAQNYLGVSVLLPTPTPGLISTPAPPQPCTNALALAAVTQEGPMPPGQPFTKIYRVQNTGSCIWNSNYRLAYVAGDRMGGEPVVIAGEVAPGSTIDIRLNLVTPIQAGEYRGIWQMVNGQNIPFGERLVVNITVPALPTVTPVQTQTPLPGITFTVDRTNINSGECVNFSWRVANVLGAYFYQEGTNWQNYPVGNEATRTECPNNAITNYRLLVIKLDNTVDDKFITIWVQPSPEAPILSRFTVDPPAQITLGQCVTINWVVEGQIDMVRIAANGELLWDPAPTTGNTQHCPSQSGVVAYTIEAAGSGGASSGQQTISVVLPATATPIPTSPPEQPIIHAFSVSPNQITVGECVSISWSAGGGTTYTRVLRDGAAIIDGAGFNGQQQDCLGTAGNHNFRFEAYNPANQMVRQEAAVFVSEAPEPNPLAGTRWNVTAYARGPDYATPLPGTRLTLVFGSDGKINISAGCNTFTASYTVQGNSLAITAPVGTSQLCDANISEQESAFLAALLSAGTFEILAEHLYMANISGLRVLETEPINR